MPSAAAMQLVHSPAQAGAMMRPLRCKLIEQLAEPDSASGLARRLNLPRQKINYHLRNLEKQGLIEFVEERRKGNCVERIMRASARSYLIDPGVLGSLATDPDKIPDKFSSAYLVAAAARCIRDLAALRARADQAGKKLPTLTLLTEIRFASAAEQAAFTQELTQTIATLTAKYHSESIPGGRRFRFFTGAYPAVSMTDPNEPTSRREQFDERR